MAQLTGPLQFIGSVGNIRSYYDKSLKRYILSTKGGANRELIMNNPAFARTRENMSDFKACSMWASRLRKALFALAHLFRGYYFSEVVSYAKKIQKYDEENVFGRRSVLSSKAPQLLQLINFNKIDPFSKVLCYPFEVTLSNDKRTVTFRVTDFISYAQLHWLTRYQSYRFKLVIAQQADMVWDEKEQTFVPVVDNMARLSVQAVSDWYSRDTDKVEICLEASFAEPALQQPGTIVVVGLGIEVSVSQNISPDIGGSAGGTMAIVACFV